jgi:hypothetical protein
MPGTVSIADSLAVRIGTEEVLPGQVGDVVDDDG